MQSALFTATRYAHMYDHVYDFDEHCSYEKQRKRMLRKVKVKTVSYADAIKNAEFLSCCEVAALLGEEVWDKKEERKRHYLVKRDDSSLHIMWKSIGVYPKDVTLRHLQRSYLDTALQCRNGNYLTDLGRYDAHGELINTFTIVLNRVELTHNDKLIVFAFDGLLCVRRTDDSTNFSQNSSDTDTDTDFDFCQMVVKNNKVYVLSWSASTPHIYQIQRNVLGFTTKFIERQRHAIQCDQIIKVPSAYKKYGDFLYTTPSKHILDSHGNTICKQDCPTDTSDHVLIDGDVIISKDDRFDTALYAHSTNGKYIGELTLQGPGYTRLRQAGDGKLIISRATTTNTHTHTITIIANPF